MSTFFLFLGLSFWRRPFLLMPWTLELPLGRFQRFKSRLAIVIIESLGNAH
jgi:hypothetical protein